VIERLVKDDSPDNTYRRSVYTSVSGGGSGSQALFFATDVLENRVHRSNFGRLLRNTGVIENDDWVLSTHWAGGLYRYDHAKIVDRVLTRTQISRSYMRDSRECGRLNPCRWKYYAPLESR
jgi:hypothetical protein